jgi:hypothetical protein
MERTESEGGVGVLDLSVGSPDLTGRDTDDTAHFTERVFSRMREDGIALGVGRYLEPRAFYLTEAFAGRGGDPRERRTSRVRWCGLRWPGGSRACGTTRRGSTTVLR